MEDYKYYKKAFELAFALLPDEERIYSPIQNSEPKWCHFFSVYKNCIRWGVTDRDVLMAAILHDILEDTSYPEKDMKKNFGEKVLKIVKVLSKKKDYKKYDPDDQEEYFGGIIGCVDPEIRVAAMTIKLADRLDNLLGEYFIDDLADIKAYVLESEKYFYVMAKEINRRSELTAALNFARQRLLKQL